MPKLNWTIVAVVVCLNIPLLAAPAASMAAALVSVTGVKMGDYDSLWGMTIKIEHARVVAVCRAFVGWNYKFDNFGEAALYKDGGAEFSGGANLGHDALRSDNLEKLQRFLLIERDEDTGPVTLHGTIHISGSQDDADRDVTFSLEKATRCP